MPKGTVKMVKIHTDENLADALTKVVLVIVKTVCESSLDFRNDIVLDLGFFFFFFSLKRDLELF